MLIPRENEMMLFGRDANNPSLRGVGYFVGMYLLITLVSALLTYPFYELFQWFNEVWHSETTDWLAHKRVDLFFDRVRLVLMALSIPVLMKMCGLLSFNQLKVSFDSIGRRNFLYFFALGMALSGLLMLLQIIFLGFRLRSGLDFMSVLGMVRDAVLGTLILAFLEEIIFRGFILRCFYAAWTPLAAVILSAAFFAYKHFKVPTEIFKTMPTASSPDFFSGFYSAWFDSIGILYNFNFVEFSTLFMLGALLGFVYLYRNSLMASIGLHGGIIFVIFLFKKMFEAAERPSHELVAVFGSTGLSDGLMALFVLSVLAVSFGAALWSKSDS